MSLWHDYPSPPFFSCHACLQSTLGGKKNGKFFAVLVRQEKNVLQLEPSNDSRVMQEYNSAAAVSAQQTGIKTSLMKQKLAFRST